MKEHPENINNISEEASTITPNKKRSFLRKVLRYFLKTIKYLFLLIVLLVVILAIAIQFSSVQTWGAKLFTNYISTNTGFEINFESVYYDFWNSEVHLKGLKVNDLQHKEMLVADDLEIQFHINEVLKNGDFHIDNITLKGACLNLITDAETRKMNLQQFIRRVNDLFSSKKKKKKREPSIVDLKKITIQNMCFGLHNNTIPLNTKLPIDFNHLDVKNINTVLENFYVKGDSIQVKINDFIAQEKSKVLNINKLNTLFRITGKSLEFNELFLNANQTTIKRNLIFRFDHIRDMSNFTKKVEIVADLDSSIVYTDDLAIFAPTVKKYNDIWRVKAKFTGKVNDFTITGADIYLKNNTHLQGDIKMLGIPNIKETYMDFDFKQANLNPEELAVYIPSKQVNDMLAKLGDISMKGSFKGFTDEFKTASVISTQLGTIKSDIALNLKGNPKYEGEIYTKGFNLGKFIGNTLLGNITIDGKIKGAGFSPNKAKFDIKASIAQVDFNRYNYKNLTIDGKYNAQKFEGEFIANDENLNFNVDGVLDFSNGVNKAFQPKGNFVLKSHIERISLKPLGFSPKTLTLQGDVELNAQGMTLDSIRGNLFLTDAYLIYDHHPLSIDHLTLNAYKDKHDKRIYTINSEFFNAKMEGNFYLSKILTDLKMLAMEYGMSLKNDSEGLKVYYEKKKEKYKEKPKSYKAKFYASIKNINPLVNLFVPNFYLSEDVDLQGEFKLGSNVIFNLYSIENIVELKFKDYVFNNINVDLHSSRLFYKPSTLSEFTFESTKQELGGLAKTEDAKINLVWYDDSLGFRTNIKQFGNSNKLKLLGGLNLLDGLTQIKFNTKSELSVLEEKWIMPKASEINFGKDFVEFKDLIIRNASINSQLAVLGRVGLDSLSATTDSITITTRNLHLMTLSNLINTNLKGSLNGKAVLKKLYTSPQIDGKFEIGELIYNDFSIGLVQFKLAWNNFKQMLEFDLKQARGNGYDWAILGDGYYQPKNKTKPFYFDLYLRRTGLAIIEPFTRGLISKVRGSIEGDLIIDGQLNNLAINGDLKLKHGRFKFDYLGTTYLFDEANIKFKPEEIVVQPINLNDKYGHIATLKGSIFHQAFNNIYLDLKGDYTNFMVLNTKEEDNSLFYGTAFATGNLKIDGFLNHMNVDIRAANEKNTKIAMPLDGYYEVSNKNYIQFVDFSKDSLTQVNKGISEVELGGITMNFHMSVNKDAAFEIIFDKKAGDIIQASGEGDLDLKIDTEGDFSINGLYNIAKGNYNFTLANLVNKGFKIDPSSTIRFTGDVFQSLLDITAIYDQRVQLKPLVDLNAVNDPENPEYRRTYPVSTLLSMRGPFLAPEIKLDLDLSETLNSTANQNLQTAVRRLDTRIKSDDQELNRQVFSLIVLKKLSPENAFTGLQGSAGSSLSELISNQFSSWLSQVDENFEIDLNINTQDINLTQFRVSYRLLDGRLRITRDGGFTNAQNQADFASVMGDWTVEYLLSVDGKYRAKMYNRTTQSSLGSVNLNSNTNTVAGFSLTQTANFDRPKDFFSIKRKKKNKSKNYQENELKDISWLSRRKKNNKKGKKKKQKDADWEVKDKKNHVYGDDDNEELPDYMKGNTKKPNVKQPKTEKIDKNVFDDKIKQSHENGDEDNLAIPENYKNKPKKKVDGDSEIIPDIYKNNKKSSIKRRKKKKKRNIKVN